MRYLLSPETWHASPNPHLSYRGARTYAQRLHLHGEVDLPEYVRRWSTEDFDWVGAHAHDEIRVALWPWLRERDYAGAEDDASLDAFLDGLGRRQAHLRPGIYVRRLWSWEQAVELDQRGTLVGEIRDAIAAVLTALDEPLPPSCQPPS